MNKNLSPRDSDSGYSRGSNKSIPPTRESTREETMSEEVLCLLNDKSLALTATDLAILRSFEREELDFEEPYCPNCGETDHLRLKDYCATCGEDLRDGQTVL
ncbi:MAG: hypothetical protein GF308_04160 [Candidatus Heimdallarchaeota archaeon]|nr:hypothetical protein [Candidatus Heimdallarchaeota archaeon]